MLLFVLAASIRWITWIYYIIASHVRKSIWETMAGRRLTSLNDMGRKSRANKLREIHPNLNKNEISGRILGLDRFESSTAELINRRHLFLTSFVMAYLTIQFIILIIQFGGRIQQEKRRKNDNSLTHLVKSHITQLVFIIDQMKRIIIIVHLSHVLT